MQVSVIIPTYNRPGQLLKLLESLANQTYPAYLFEVIVVDDGSSESYAEVVEQPWPFRLDYHRQDNQGEAIARNYGVQMSHGELLVFLDDDMVVEPAYLEAIHAEHIAHPQALLIGTMYVRPNPGGSIFQRLAVQSARYATFGEVAFTEILGGVLAVSRLTYQELHGMRPFPDFSRGGWLDMDFAYRAHTTGYRLRRCAGAVAYHDDHVLKNLTTSAKRMYKVSYLAAFAFKTHPELRAYIPMFNDKAPVDLRRDPVSLIIRKLARHIASSRPVLWGMGQLVSVLEQRHPSPALLRPLYRWILGAYIFQGYRQGLREYAGH